MVSVVLLFIFRIFQYKMKFGMRVTCSYGASCSGMFLTFRSDGVEGNTFMVKAIKADVSTKDV